MKKQPVLFFGEFLRSAARAQNHAETALLFQGQGSRVNSRGLQGFRRRRQGQRQHAGHMLAFPFLHPGQFVEVRDLARDLHLNFRRIETRNASNPAFPLQDSRGERSVPHTVRAHRPHACDHHTSLHSPTPMLVSIMPKNYIRKAQ